MKKLSKGFILLLMSMVLTFSVYSNGQAESTGETIRFAYITPELTPQENFETASAYAFRDYVEEKTNGNIKVDLFPAGQLGNFSEMAQSVISGDLDVAIINTIPMGGFYKNCMVFGMPGVFNSMEECNSVIMGDWGTKFNAAMEKDLGIKIIAHYSVGFRHFTNSVKPITLPEDAKGLTFRVMESPVSIKMVEAIGANAVPIPSSEMYLAMQNHVVDGQENPIGAVIQDHTYEVQKYMVLDAHFTSSEMIIMSDKFYNSLTDAQKKIVQEAGLKSIEAASKVVADKEVTGLDFLRSKGMEIVELSDAQSEKWHNAVRGATESYIRTQVDNSIVDELLANIKSFRSK